jgi:hypothetical protein
MDNEGLDQGLLVIGKGWFSSFGLFLLVAKTVCDFYAYYF